MSTVITHPAVDVVVMGEGVMGGEISIKLALGNYKVVGIEKGPYWDYTTDFAITKYDEYGIQINGVARSLGIGIERVVFTVDGSRPGMP